jgi:hypothetical protein
MLCASSSQYPHRLLTSLFIRLPNPLLPELPLWFPLDQRKSFQRYDPTMPEL